MDVEILTNFLQFVNYLYNVKFNTMLKIARMYVVFQWYSIMISFSENKSLSRGGISLFTVYGYAGFLEKSW